MSIDNIEKMILVSAINSLNSLEGNNCESVDIMARNVYDAHELRICLDNYNVEITKGMGAYLLKVSKKEKK